jgi:hypothetical protein
VKNRIAETRAMAATWIGARYAAAGTSITNDQFDSDDFFGKRRTSFVPEERSLSVGWPRRAIPSSLPSSRSSVHSFGSARVSRCCWKRRVGMTLIRRYSVRPSRWTGTMAATSSSRETDPTVRLLTVGTPFSSVT